MSFITLGDLTPYEPWDDRGQAEYIEKTYPPNRKPRFPFNWQKDGVLIGSWIIAYSKVHTGGFDPYSGEKWELKTKYLTISMCDCICPVITVKFFGYEYDKRWAWHKDVSWFWRKIWDALDYRYEWFQYNEHVPEWEHDYYGRNE